MERDERAGGAASDGEGEVSAPGSVQGAVLRVDWAPPSGIALGPASYVIADADRALVAVAGVPEAPAGETHVFEVTLPEGRGYKAFFVANPVETTLECSASAASFDLTRGHTTHVSAAWTCVDRTPGQILISPNPCQEQAVGWIEVAPVATSLGGVISLRAPAMANQGEPIEYTWSSAQAGSFVTTLGAVTSFTCNQVQEAIPVALSIRRGRCSYARHATLFCFEPAR